MAAKPKEYRRLPGQGIRTEGLFSVSASRRRVRLWLGPDHLLLVESKWYAEDYRRFYFRDIQAVIIQKTNKGHATNLVLGLLGLFCLIGALAARGGWQIFWGVMTSVFSFFLILNALYGPTCICHFRTAVQMEEMPSLRRLNRARKVLARLRPLIAAAQGQLAPEEITARMAQPATYSADEGIDFSTPPTASPPSEAPPAQ